jgi:hypothetical protein
VLKNLRRALFRIHDWRIRVPASAVEFAAENELLPLRKGFFGPELLVLCRSALGILFIVVWIML